jgi:hypothetical protein
MVKKMGFDSIWFCIDVGIVGIILMMVFMFMTFVVQRQFIVKRYEEETNLWETKFFKPYRDIGILVSFPIFKPVFYSTHLFLVMLLSSRIMKKLPSFSGSPSHEQILSYFSRKECILTAVGLGSGFLGLFLVFVSNFLHWYWKL